MRFKRFQITLVVFARMAFGQPSAVPERSRLGYLNKAEIPDVARIVPPAPVTGDARYVSDMAIFEATRRLQDSPRWAIARSDDNISIAGLFQAFQCSLGRTLTQQNAPNITALISRANIDAGAASNVLKELYQHKRPFQTAEGNVCLSSSGKAALERVPDYPSGHATVGWEAGLIFAEIAPDLAGEVLARARAFGQSRVVCGVHNASAIEAGWMTATSVFAVQNSSAAFRTDLDAARSEWSALRSGSTPKPEGCALEAETLSKSPY